MNNISLLNYGTIRVNENNQFSVFDTIRVVGGKKNPWEAWKRLAVEYPEILQKCEDSKFPGVRQKSTLVATTENIFYIIGLLPGAVGKAYREDAAREMCKKYGVSYDSLVETEEVIAETVPDLNLATLELATKIGDGIVKSHNIMVAKLQKLENLVQGSAVDVKGEIREGNHSLSEELMSVREAIQSDIADLKDAIASKSPKRADKSITFHCNTEEEYQEMLKLVDASGMSRSRFFLEIAREALNIGND